MQDTAFNLLASLAFVLVLAFCYRAYLKWLQSLAVLTGFSALEIRVVKCQLLAVATWTLLVTVGVMVALWSGQQALFSLPGSLIIAGANWLLIGFIAVTSIVPGISIVGMRNGGRPARGRASIIWGIVVLAFLTFWTYQAVLRQL